MYRELEEDARDRGQEDIADFFGEIQAQEVRRYFRARALEKERSDRERASLEKDFQLKTG